MSINIFFIVILGFLMAMYGYFNPNYIEKRDTKEIAKVQLQSFTLYEVSQNGIEYILEGDQGLRYDDRYEITSAKFSDNTKHFLQFIGAHKAYYRDDTISLSDGVFFEREDGLKFSSDEGVYNTKTSLVTIQGPFAITQKNNHFEGENLHYNTMLDTLSADKISGSYQFN